MRAFHDGFSSAREWEVATLLPKSVCWLSKGVGLPVAQSLVDQWDSQRLKFGEVVRVKIETQRIPFVVTKWPGRGAKPTNWQN